MTDKINCSYCEIDIIETGNRIYVCLQQHSITPKAAAKLLMVSPQAVYKWINGECLPSLENMVQLSLILNTPIDDLIVKKVLHSIDISDYYVREFIPGVITDHPRFDYRLIY